MHSAIIITLFYHTCHILESKHSNFIFYWRSCQVDSTLLLWITSLCPTKRIHTRSTNAKYIFGVSNIDRHCCIVLNNKTLLSMRLTNPMYFCSQSVTNIIMKWKGKYEKLKFFQYLLFSNFSDDVLPIIGGKMRFVLRVLDV